MDWPPRRYPGPVCFCICCILMRSSGRLSDYQCVLFPDVKPNRKKRKKSRK